MESQSRVCGDEGRSNVWTLGTTQTRQSAMMKRVAFSFPPLRPSMSSHIPFKPHCTLLHCPAWPAWHLPRSYMRLHPALPAENCIRSHQRMEKCSRDWFHWREIDERLDLGWKVIYVFVFCCSCFFILNFCFLKGSSSLDLSPRLDVDGWKALAAVYLTSYFMVEMSLCQIHLLVQQEVGWWILQGWLQNTDICIVTANQGSENMAINPTEKCYSHWSCERKMMYWFSLKAWLAYIYLYLVLDICSESWQNTQ